MITIRTAIKLGLALFVALVAIGALPVTIAICIAVYALGVLFFIPDHSPVPPTAEPVQEKHAEPVAEQHAEPATGDRFSGLIFPETPKPSDVNDPYVAPTPKPVPPWHRPLASFMQRIAPYCGDVLAKIAARDFGADPILTREQARLAGVINSAIGQHGKLIEKAILEALQDSEQLDAVCEPEFKFSHGDTNYHKAATVEGASLASLPYGDGHQPHDTFAVDLIVFDKVSKIVRAYEIKRNRLDVISADKLRMVRSLLLSYAQTVRQWDAVSAEAWSINYYSAPAHKGGTWRLTSADLDQHFGCKIFDEVERATASYRAELQTILSTPLEKAA